MSASAAAAVQALLRPRSIAIIGASPDRRKNAAKPAHFLREHGFPGAVYPVNPKYDDILGWRCYPSVLAIPDPVDAAVVVVPAERAEGAIEECGRKGVRAAVVISSGFGEVGPEGQEAERRLVAVAHRYGLRLCGPNSVGVINAHASVAASFSQAADGRPLHPGGLALVSQSGNFGTFMIELALRREIGFSHFVSSGNEADLSFLDYVEYLITDPDARVIAGYLEGLRDAGRLQGIGAAAAAARKPIVVVKVGRSNAGARSAISHTGAVVGDDAVYDAAFRQSRILRVDSEEELLDVLPLLLGGRWPRGRRVAVVSVSGGGATIMADACEAEGLDVPVFDPVTQEALRQSVPYYGAVGNPVDLTGQVLATEGSVRQCLQAVLADPGIDAVILFLGLMERKGEQIANEILEATRESAIPLVVSWVAGPASPIARLRQADICVTTAPAVACARALAHAVRYAEWIGEAKAPARRTAARAAGVARGGRVLPGDEAMQLLATVGVPTPRRIVVRDARAAAHAAEEIGFPVCVKVERPVIPHKTEAGALRLDLANADAVRWAAEALIDVGRGLAAGEEVTLAVEARVAPGLEVLLSAERDAQFGSRVSFGLGGVHAEVFRDVATRILPVSPEELEEMCAGIRAAPLLGPFRGQPPRDVGAIVQTLRALAALLERRPDVRLVEVNPFVVWAAGQGGVAVDALVELRHE